jgi:hypothetical protein
VTGCLCVNGWNRNKEFWKDPGLDHLTLTAPGLPQVPFVELTTDCVWVFGREDPWVAFQISSLLPYSLTSFHLIGYWAVAVMEGGVRLDSKELS